MSPNPAALGLSFQTVRRLINILILILIAASPCRADLISEHAHMMAKAVETEDEEQIRKLLKTPYVSVNDDIRTIWINGTAETWLQLAASRCKLTSVRVLLESGADPNYEANRVPPLWQVYSSQFVNHYRVKNGVNNNNSNSNRWYHECVDVFALLLDFGADPWEPASLPLMFGMAVECVPFPDLLHVAVDRMKTGRVRRNVLLPSGRNFGHVFVRAAMALRCSSALPRRDRTLQVAKSAYLSKPVNPWSRDPNSILLFDFNKKDELGLRPLDYIMVGVGPDCSHIQGQRAQAMREQIIESINKNFLAAGAMPVWGGWIDFTTPTVCDKSFHEIK